MKAKRECDHVRKALLDLPLARKERDDLPESIVSHLSTCRACSEFNKAMDLLRPGEQTGPLYTLALRQKALGRIADKPEERLPRLSYAFFAGVGAMNLFLTFVFPYLCIQWILG
ncbi:hypothetical protein ACFLU6_10650, partial [Acidobacteriota bacterium]